MFPDGREGLKVANCVLVVLRMGLGSARQAVQWLINSRDAVFY